MHRPVERLDMGERAEVGGEPRGTDLLMPIAVEWHPLTGCEEFKEALPKPRQVTGGDLQRVWHRVGFHPRVVAVAVAAQLCARPDRQLEGVQRLAVIVRRSQAQLVERIPSRGVVPIPCDVRNLELHSGSLRRLRCYRRYRWTAGGRLGLTWRATGSSVNCRTLGQRLSPSLRRRGQRSDWASPRSRSCERSV